MIAADNYAARTELIEEALTEHFRAVWLSPAGQKALRKAIKKVSHERDRERPNRVKEFETRLADLDRQIRRGTENLLLVDAGDIPDLKRILDGWRGELGGLILVQPRFCSKTPSIFRSKCYGSLDCNAIKAHRLSMSSWPNSASMAITNSSSSVLLVARMTWAATS